MPNFTFTQGRPAGNLSPAGQRQSMQTNNDSNFSIWAVDHYGFNDNDGGTHKFLTIPNVQVPAAPTAQSGVISTTVTSVADTNKAQLLFQNSGTTVPLSCLRAFCTFNSGVGASGARTLDNVYNISTATRSTAVKIDFTMPAGVVVWAGGGPTYCVFAFGGNGNAGGIPALTTTSITSATTFSLLSNAASALDNSVISVMVLQF